MFFSLKCQNSASDLMQCYCAKCEMCLSISSCNNVAPVTNLCLASKRAFRVLLLELVYQRMNAYKNIFVYITAAYRSLSPQNVDEKIMRSTSRGE